MKELLFFIFFVIVFIGLIFDNVKMKLKNMKLANLLLQERINNNIFVEKTFLNQNNETSEDFIKFITKSRDDAFKYIEQVQAAINEFKVSTERDFAYFDEFGILSTDPLYDLLKRISESKTKLFEMLPSDYGKIDT